MKTPNSPQFNHYYDLHCKHLKLKGLQPKTIDAYSRAIRRIGVYFNGCLDHLSEEQLLNYFYELLNRLSWSAVKLDLYGLKFFYTHVLKRPWVDIPLIKPPKTSRIPDIVTIDEVNQLFQNTRKLSYRIFFFTLYSLGLRLGEGLKLEVGDIDAHRMRVHIRSAKGNKDRFVPLPLHTLMVLRQFWSVHKHTTLLFPNRKRGLKNAHLAESPLDRGGVQNCIREVTKHLGLKKISCHSLRHSYATHLLEAGVDILELKVILGHVSLLTTAKYTHLTVTSIAKSEERINLLMNQFDLSWGRVR